MTCHAQMQLKAPTPNQGLDAWACRPVWSHPVVT